MTTLAALLQLLLMFASGSGAELRQPLFGDGGWFIAQSNIDFIYHAAIYLFFDHYARTKQRLKLVLNREPVSAFYCAARGDHAAESVDVLLTYWAIVCCRYAVAGYGFSDDYVQANLQGQPTSDGGDCSHAIERPRQYCRYQSNDQPLGRFERIMIQFVGSRYQCGSP